MIPQYSAHGQYISLHGIIQWLSGEFPVHFINSSSEPRFSCFSSGSRAGCGGSPVAKQWTTHFDSLQVVLQRPLNQFIGCCRLKMDSQKGLRGMVGDKLHSKGAVLAALFVVHLRFNNDPEAVPSWFWMVQRLNSMEHMAESLPTEYELFPAVCKLQDIIWPFHISGTQYSRHGQLHMFTHSLVCTVKDALMLAWRWAHFLNLSREHGQERGGTASFNETKLR